MDTNWHARKQPNVQNNFITDGASQFPGTSQQQTQAMTFWTVCPSCGIRYECSLCCQNCQQPFVVYAFSAQGNIHSNGSSLNGKEQCKACEKNEKQQAEAGKKVERSKDESSDEYITYADSEFNDFDKDRTESKFSADQIWASYDTDGCMPRYYVRIERIISEQSKLDVTCLEPCPSPNNQDEVDWVEKKLPFACGIFKNGSKRIVDFLSLSYLVSWEKGWNTGRYWIYPRKGDVWALFKDWNIKWSSDVDMHREYKFEVVEVLSDYDEGTGVEVKHLVKLKGFVSLFHETRKDSFQIPPDELLRFSHKIPSFRMTGKERTDVPEGSYDLDPASLPSDIEEVEFVRLKSFDNVVVDVEHAEAQANCSYSKLVTEYQNCKMPSKRIELNDTSKQGLYAKKQKHTDSGEGNPDGVVHNKEREEDVIKCQTEKAKNLDAARRGPASAALEGSVNVRTTGMRQAPPHLNKNIQRNFTNDSASQFPGRSEQQTQAMTFWTVCPFCGTRYQYYQTVMNRALCCQNCQKPFIAYSINATQPGATSGHWWNPSETQQKEGPSQNAAKVGHQGTGGNSSFSTGFQGASMPESVLKTVSCSEFGGRFRNKAAERRAKSEEEKQRAHSRKRGRKLLVKESSESCDTDISDEDEVVAEDLAGQTFETSSSRYPWRSTRQKQCVTYNEDGSDDDDFFDPPTSQKPRGVVSGESDDQRENKEESKEGYASQTSEPISAMPNVEDKKKDNQKGNLPSKEGLPNGKEQSETYKKNEKQDVGKKVEISRDEDSSDEDFPFSSDHRNQSNSDSMTYAEPEFNDFDKDRTESKFSVDQIWAAYDTDGCMPRFYARIRRIITEQSKLDVTWLEPSPSPNNQDEVNWVANDLPFACGIFKNGNKGKVDFCSFSYLVSWEKGRDKGRYRIYPRKGDIWALFKDWNIKWSSDVDMHREYKFEVVEVLSDYDEGNGVKVTSMVKLKGFTSLFHQTRNREKESFHIPPNEVLRFSHKIPSYRMTGKERADVPEGSYELDPASLPTDIEEVEFVHLKSFDVKHAEPRANGCFSGSATENYNCKMPNKCKEPNEKNIQKNDNTAKQGPSPGRINGVYEKKQKHLDSGKGNPDVIVHDKEREEDVIKCQKEKANNSNAVKRDPPSAAKSDTSSPVASTGENCEYPDPEFYVFDADKSGDKFQPGQIWALYSDADGLPKFYCQIKEVSSTDFGVGIKWLEAHRTLDGELRWADEGLPYGCGKFSLSEGTEVFNTNLTFSHMVKAEASSKNIYRIYPREGEIWAVYKKLSVDWTLSDLENCGYDIVRVLGKVGSGLRVTFMEKLGGYNSVFKDGGLEMVIPRKEFLRFSHQIPAFRLTEERGGKLRGYVELDPAAVPPILFCTTSD